MSTVRDMKKSIVRVVGPYVNAHVFSLTLRARKVFVFLIKETFYYTLFSLLRIG